MTNNKKCNNNKKYIKRNTKLESKKKILKQKNLQIDLKKRKKNQKKGKNIIEIKRKKLRKKGKKTETEKNEKTKQISHSIASTTPLHLATRSPLSTSYQHFQAQNLMRHNISPSSSSSITTTLTTSS